jgi:hypothetical protein
MKAVYALYDDGRAADRAVRSLRAAGVSDGDITVITPEPMEEREFSEIGRESPLWYVASAGGLLGFALGTWLTRFTELSWPILTGNMPIVSWWPNLIVMFELTMLGAILATVATMIATGGLFRRRPALYDPEVMDGKILVGVANPRDARIPDLERALMVTPDVRLKTI